MGRTGVTFRKVAVIVGVAAVFPVMPYAAAQDKVGVNSAVNPQAQGTPPSAPTRRLELGQEVVHDERIVTATEGQTQILFLDASAMTVGPNSDLTIDNFVYNPNADTGQLSMSMTKGVMRFVGGKVSKLEGGVSMRTPSASIGIRGGVFLLSVSPSGQVDVIFLYGKGLIVNANNQTVVITRPGWGVTISGPGASPSPASPASTIDIANLLNQLTGRVGSAGGSFKPPTEYLIAGSSISGVLSGNFAASTQQAMQNSPPKTQLEVIDIGGLTTQFQINDASVQPVVAGITQGPGGPSSGAIMPAGSPMNTATTPGSPITSQTTTGTITSPTVAFPTMGAGSYTGTALGTVVNNGSTYQATGNFSQVYNFGSQIGTANISNFDGANYGYGVSGSGANFSGSLSSGPANRTGNISGAFSGSGATQSSGNFGVQSTSAPSYTVSGTFSGR